MQRRARLSSTATYAVIAARRDAPTSRAQRHPLAAAPRRDRGRRAADRPGAARRAADARARRPRDDRQLARLDLRAAACARPHAYDRLREAVRGGDEDDGAAYVEATIHEAMRSRPVIPIIGRRVTVPWQLGEYRPAGRQPVLISILLLHHREDLYPDPFAFRPERFLGRKPGHLRPGSRSAAASAAASAPRWRWPSSAWCSRRSPAALDLAAARSRARARAPPQRDDDPGSGGRVVVTRRAP